MFKESDFIMDKKVTSLRLYPELAFNPRTPRPLRWRILHALAAVARLLSDFTDMYASVVGAGSSIKPPNKFGLGKWSNVVASFSVCVTVAVAQTVHQGWANQVYGEGSTCGHGRTHPGPWQPSAFELVAAAGVMVLPGGVVSAQTDYKLLHD